MGCPLRLSSSEIASSPSPTIPRADMYPACLPLGAVGSPKVTAAAVPVADSVEEAGFGSPGVSPMYTPDIVVDTILVDIQLR